MTAPPSIDWPFDDPPNLAVIVDKRILSGETWVYYVGHDEDDGGWQFHGYDGFAKVEDARVVGLRTMVRLDGAIAALADLPLGWCAWRGTPQSDWQRAPQPIDEDEAE